jgi:hypothetical protein
MKSSRIFGIAVAATVAAVTVLGGVSAGRAYAAGSASFSLSPTGSTYNVNSSFSIVISETSTDPVNVVTADLTYDASQLQFLGVDANGSDFGGEVSSTGGGGSVSISRYVTPAGGNVTGTKRIATVNFKALAGSGSTAVSFAGSSKIASNGSNVWNGDTTGGSYNLATPSAGQGGGGMTTTTSNGSAQRLGVATNSTGNNGNNAAAPDAMAEGTVQNTPAPTNEKAEDIKKDDKKQNNQAADTAAKKESRSWWPWIILLITLATIGTIIYRQRKVEEVESTVKKSSPAGEQTEAKKDDVRSAVAAGTAAAASKKAAESETATSGTKNATKRKKSTKKGGRKSR